jgi:NIPSNAP
MPPDAELDVRTYKLVPGGSEAFDRILREDALPMLERFGIRVVACGPSADAADNYYLIRSFSSSAERHKQLDAFYGSDEWRRNHREAVMQLIESYHIVVIELTPRVRTALAEAG